MTETEVELRKEIDRLNFKLVHEQATVVRLRSLLHVAVAKKDSAVKLLEECTRYQQRTKH